MTERIARLVHAINKLSKWAGVDIGELIEHGYLEEGDMNV